ncbi:PREDICTED: uncharacterized protein LOC108550465 [Eufriesea mexicana]|uniref:uncharacterized protein LOC108550465 n=1 Tax=Eufriesea mexicana TaxID=516756 RepID=UPI00083BE3A9|nr:PREDICTED: uncharacterized protein LOC108550465 [Eufriesea mexicana]
MTSTQISTHMKQLIQKRAILKTQVTRILTYLNDTPDASIISLEIRQKRLEQLYDYFSETQTVLELGETNEETDHSSEREKFENEYYLAANLITDRLKELYKPARPASDVKPTDSSSNTFQALLGIKLEPFDGNPFQWHDFRCIFMSLVQDCENLSGVQKLLLLKNFVCGDAAAVIASLNATEENYLVAWDLLKKQCYRPRLLIDAHLQHLLELPVVTCDSPSKLRHLIRQVQIHVGKLKVLEQPTEHWDTILIHILVKKLDEKTRRAWERSLEDDEIPTFNQLVACIKKQIREYELEQKLPDSLKSNTSDNRSQGKTQNRDQSVSTQTQQQCIVCEEEHSIYTCPRFLQSSANDRFNTAKRLKLCVNCLGSNHLVSNCRSWNCRKCEKRHHTLLHF